MKLKSSDIKTLKQKGLRNTRHRRSILEVLEKSKEPMTAVEVFLKLKPVSCNLNLSTVYRTFETLTANGFTLKTSLFNDGKARFEINRDEHRHHAVCIGCHKIISIENCPIGVREMKILRKKTGFSATGHKLEIYGYCGDCSAVNRGKDA